MADREAYLRPEYAAWYPSLPAGTWVGAYTVQYLVALQLKYGEPRWQAGNRLLDPEHFLFRGGLTGGQHTFDRRHPHDPGIGRVPNGEAATSD
jgi:hypothetical protein